MSFLRLSNIEKFFGDFHAIRSLDLEIEKGKFIVFVGPSGSGKSTLLRLIAGLENVDEGVLELEGNDITEVRPSKRDLAMVFQTYALYPHMSVSQNMSFSLMLLNKPKNEIHKKVKEVANMLNLTPYLHRFPKELSGGQRQRVAIGRAIIRNPKIFLFDEPLSNLDAGLRSQTRVEIANLHKRLGATTIYVTHDQIEAMTLADQVVVLHNGVIEQVAPPLELFNHPANLFVAQFIGNPKMNIAPIDQLPDKTKKSVFKHFKAKKNQAKKIASIGIRAESIEIKTKADADSISANIFLTENLGPEAFVHLKTDKDLLFVCHLSKQFKMKKENKVFINLDWKKVHYFDSDGKALKNH